MEKRRYKIKPPEVWTQVRKDYLSGLDAKTVAARHDVPVREDRQGPDIPVDARSPPGPGHPVPSRDPKDS